MVRDLATNTRFTWRTLGVAGNSTTREFEPSERIARDGTAWNCFHLPFADRTKTAVLSDPTPVQIDGAPKSQKIGPVTMPSMEGAST